MLKVNLVLFLVLLQVGWAYLGGSVIAVRGGWAAVTCGLDGVEHLRCLAHMAGRAEAVTGAWVCGLHVALAFHSMEAGLRVGVTVESELPWESRTEVAGLLFFLSFYFILEYSWSITVLCYFQVDSKGTQPYLYMYPFSPKLPSHPGCHMTLSRVPCAIQ